MIKRLTALWLVLVTILAAPLVIQMTGCASANRNTYVAMGTKRVTVQTGLGLWDQLVKSGKTTVAQEQAVKAAYIKVQGAAILLCDAGKALAAASQNTDATTMQKLTAAFDQAVSDYTADRNDFLNILTVYGVTLP